MNKLKIFFQHVLPKHAISVLAGKLADVKIPWLKNRLIKYFAKAYNIDMSIAIEPELTNYESFNHFFTRAIELEFRPVDMDSNCLSCPVDGAVSQFGQIKSGQIIQAKGHQYSALDLLGGDRALAANFDQGAFCTIYLAPKDYHRIHMPCDGTLESMIHVPGQLFSVNPLTARNVPNLFARNERVVSVFSTRFGKMAMVLVGATIVGSIETVWAGNVTPPTRKQIETWQYSAGEHSLSKGQEMGRFKLGSTVILLMEKKNWQWDSSTQLEANVILGQRLIYSS